MVFSKRGGVKTPMGSVLLIFIRLISWLYFLQPRKLQILWGNVLGSFLRLIRIRAKVVEKNLEYIFPGDSKKNFRARVFKESYLYLGNLVLEIFLVFGPMKKFVKKNVTLLGLENIQNSFKSGKGAFFLASHLGNWEVMAATGGILAELDLMLVTKQLKPAWLHEAIEKGRKTYGVSATYEPRTLKDILSHLKKNKIVGFVMDQYAGPPVGARIPFFGIPVGTPLALATLVKRTGAVVLPVKNYRTPDGRWVVDVSPPLAWESHEDPHYELAHNTARYIATIEEAIRENPAQWLWTHRRFKGDLSPLRPGEWNDYRIRK